MKKASSQVKENKVCSEKRKAEGEKQGEGLKEKDCPGFDKKGSPKLQ